MSLVLLVRHGQASFGAADYDRLSALGVEQSRLVGESLAARGVRPDVVLRGSLRRHRETAEAAVAAAGWDVEVAEDAGWDEFGHLPQVPAQEAEPTDRDELVAFVDRSITRWASGEHDGDYREGFPAFQARVGDALDRLLTRLGPRQLAVVVTSGGPVSWVTADLLDGGPPVWRRLSRVVVNSSATKVVAGRRGTTLVSFNDHSHLEADPTLITYR